jgi:DNA-3-methyladenine glycosylase I
LVSIAAAIADRSDPCAELETMPEKQRCRWAVNSSLEMAYHDAEWGVPVHDDRKLFEFLVLEGAQAGLSWSTILKKRAGYRRGFDYFDAAAVAGYDARKVQQLLQDPNIIRNSLKVNAAVVNARAFLKIQAVFGTFDSYIWRFVGHRPKVNRRVSQSDIPAQTQESQDMSRDLKKRGFKFVGPTICYAFMQAVGMVNDHVIGCYRYEEILNGYD